MRVVCDNCGAVYKIADSKLTKEVNKATCKRCGHKIVIYKAGSGRGDGPSISDAEERTVIKSVEGLDKLSQGTGKVPAIGSLTAELRAISLPGVNPVTPPKPATLSASGLGPAPATVPPRPSPPGIPPKDAPATAVYHGPRPDLPPLPLKPGVPVAPPMPDSESDATRPMSHPPPAVVPQMPLPPAKHSTPTPLSASRPELPAVGAAGSIGGMPALPPVGSTAPAPPKKGQPAESIIPPELQTGRTQAIKEPAPTATVPGRDGSSELGVIAGLGALTLFGVGATLAAPPISTLGIGLAGLGATACLFLPILSQRGRKAGQTGIALFLGLLVGAGLGFLAHTMANTSSPDDGLGGIPLEDPRPAPTPAPAPEPAPDPADADPVDPAPSEDGLSAEERAEARKFTEAATPAPAPEPTPAPVRQPDPTPAPRPVEAATPAPPKEDNGLRELSRPKKPAAPGEAPDVGGDSGGGSSGPSPFVIDTIIRNNANINRCFTLEKARGTDISGKIYLKFSIAPDGAVSRARITTSRFAGTALDQCVSKEVNQLNFPPFDGETQQVRYPFTVL
jgi:predicted Zn finger-like uncharacterized protein